MQKAYTWGKKATAERKASRVLKAHIHTCCANRQSGEPRTSELKMTSDR